MLNFQPVGAYCSVCVSDIRGIKYGGGGGSEYFDGEGCSTEILGSCHCVERVPE